MIEIITESIVPTGPNGHQILLGPGWFGDVVAHHGPGEKSVAGGDAGHRDAVSTGGDEINVVNPDRADTSYVDPDRGDKSAADAGRGSTQYAGADTVEEPGVDF